MIIIKIVGISVNRPVEQCEENLDHWWGALSGLLGSDPELGRGDYTIDDGYVGPDYGIATTECLDAIVVMASREGILLDPVYSGKAFAGLLGHAAAGRFDQGATVVMLHSGGVPATFAYHAEIETHLESLDDR